MEREMKDVGMTWVALSKKAQDRDVWYTLTGVRGNDDDDDVIFDISRQMAIKKLG